MSHNRGPDTDDIGCLEAIEALYAYLDGEIHDPAQLRAIEHHLGHCRSCFTRMELERTLTSHARKAATGKAPEALQQRLQALLDKL